MLDHLHLRQASTITNPDQSVFRSILELIVALGNFWSLGASKMHYNAPVIVINHLVLESTFCKQFCHLISQPNFGSNSLISAV